MYKVQSVDSRNAEKEKTDSLQRIGLFLFCISAKYIYINIYISCAPLANSRWLRACGMDKEGYRSICQASKDPQRLEKDRELMATGVSRPDLIYLKAHSLPGKLCSRKDTRRFNLTAI